VCEQNSQQQAAHRAKLNPLHSLQSLQVDWSENSQEIQDFGQSDDQNYDWHFWKRSSNPITRAKSENSVHSLLGLSRTTVYDGPTSWRSTTSCRRHNWALEYQRAIISTQLWDQGHSSLWKSRSLQDWINRCWLGFRLMWENGALKFRGHCPILHGKRPHQSRIVYKQRWITQTGLRYVTQARRISQPKHKPITL